MAEKNTWLWVLVVVGVLIFIANPNILSGIFGNNGSGGNNGNNNQYIVSSSTALSYAGVDALSPGTTVGSISYTSVNGGPFVTGITTASQGDTLAILLVNGTTYHSVSIPSNTVPAGKTTDVITANFYANASVSITVFNTNGVAITNNGGATNQTVATGGAYNMNVRLDGQDKKSTQDMRCVLESSDGSKADTVTLSGLGASYIGMAKPSSYTLAGANSQVWVYDISPITGATSSSGTIAVTSKTSQSLTGTKVIMQCFTKEYYIDSTTGKVAYGMEDSLGNLKSWASYKFTVYFT
jgi:hypothetical protein